MTLPPSIGEVPLAGMDVVFGTHSADSPELRAHPTATTPDDPVYDPAATAAAWAYQLTCDLDGGARVASKAACDTIRKSLEAIRPVPRPRTAGPRLV